MGYTPRPSKVSSHQVSAKEPHAEPTELAHPLKSSSIESVTHLEKGAGVKEAYHGGIETGEIHTTGHPHDTKGGKAGRKK